MTRLFYSTPVGNELPPEAEIVWNGTYDKAVSQYWQARARPAPPAHPGFGQPPRASAAVATSTRGCDRVLRYLLAHRQVAHTSRAVAEAVGLDVKAASVWLRRFRLRGLLEITHTVPPTVLGGRPCAIYHVRGDARG